MFDPAPQVVPASPVPTPTHPSVNGPNLLRLADAIEFGKALPDLQFDMNHWLAPVITKVEGGCGTAGCIGGHAYLLFGKNDLSSYDLPLGDGYIMPMARKVLGLDAATASQLMTPNVANSGVRCALAAYSANRKQAAAVLRNLAYTGKVEWAKFL